MIDKNAEARALNIIKQNLPRLRDSYKRAIADGVKAPMAIFEELEFNDFKVSIAASGPNADALEEQGFVNLGRWLRGRHPRGLAPALVSPLDAPTMAFHWPINAPTFDDLLRFANPDLN